MTARVSEWQATVVGAPGDGIGPAILIAGGGSRPGQQRAQYLVGAPEGFARLALEHKIRPSSALKAVFLPSLRPEAAGGVPGLILRLASDGHEEVEVFGPRGTGAYVSSFSPIFSWKHPRVLVSSVDGPQASLLYSDEHVEVSAVVQGRAWESRPAWLGGPARAPTSDADASLPEVSPSSPASESSSESSDSSSADSEAGDRDRDETRTDRTHPAAPGPVSLPVIRSPPSASFDRFPHGSSPLYTDTPVPSTRHPAPSHDRSVSLGRPASQPEPGTRLLMLLFYFRAIDCVLPITMCESLQDVAELRSHAATSLLQATPPTRRTIAFQMSPGGWLPTRAALRDLAAAANAPRVAVAVGGVPPRRASGSDEAGRCAGTNADGRAHAHTVAGFGEWAPVGVSGAAETLEGAEGFQASSRTSARLGFLCPRAFPVPHVGRWRARGRPALRECGGGVAGSVGMVSGTCAERSGASGDGATGDAGVGPRKRPRVGEPGPAEAGGVGVATSEVMWCPLLFSTGIGPVSVRQGTGTGAGVKPRARAESARVPEPVDEAGVQGDLLETHPWAKQRAAEVERAMGRAMVALRGARARLQGNGGPGDGQGWGGLQSHAYGQGYANWDRGWGVWGEQGSLGAQTRLGSMPMTPLPPPPVAPTVRNAEEISLGSSSPSSSQPGSPRADGKPRPGRKGDGGDGRGDSGSCDGDSSGSDDGGEKGAKDAASAPDHGVHDAVCGPESVSVATLAALGSLEEWEVVFLGTGSAEPSEYRGSSGILLMRGWRGCAHEGEGKGGCGGLGQGEGQSGNGYMQLPAAVLLDCGEGTWGAMVRHLGPAVSREVAARLAIVWVSHKHADHCVGLPGVLRARAAAQAEAGGRDERPLWIVGPWQCKSWLSQCLPVQSLSCRFLQFKDAQWSSGHPQRRGAWADVLCAVGLASLSSVPVEHCADAHAVVLSHASGWRLCYSGDTRPSRALARAAHGCTMLIHEATFEPGLQGQAERKRHSTTAEALSASLQAGAERVVLTHFSQRYPKYPAGVFPDIQATAEAAAAAAAGDDRGDTLTVTAPIAVHGEAQHAPDPIVAFDGLRCSLADLLVLPLASRLLAEALTEVPEAGADVEA